MASSLRETKAALAKAHLQLRIVRETLRSAAPSHTSPLDIRLTDEISNLEKDLRIISDRIERAVNRVGVN